MSSTNPHRPLRDADDETLLFQVGLEIHGHKPMELVLRPETAFGLCALMQLALRHPGVRGNGNYLLGAAFIAGVQSFFADAPATLEVLRRGDEPVANDVWTLCSQCGRAICHRPYAPTGPPKVCLSCAAAKGIDV